MNIELPAPPKPNSDIKNIKFIFIETKMMEKIIKLYNTNLIYKLKKINEKMHIIFGISGQDHFFYAHFLLSRNYNVIGITRNNSKRNLNRLYKLNIQNKVKIIKGEATDYKFCYKILKKSTKFTILLVSHQ